MDCTPSVSSSQTVETELLGGAKTIIDANGKKAINGYWICVSNLTSGFKAKATEENKNLLITGAATRVGKAIALHFARRGWNIAIHYFLKNLLLSFLRPQFLEQI